MYELNCPACGHKVQRAFVRVGARTACEACGQRYQILSEHLARHVVLPSGEGEGANPLLFGPPPAPPPPATLAPPLLRPRPAAKAPTPPPAAGGANPADALAAAVNEHVASPVRAAAPTGPAPASVAAVAAVAAAAEPEDDPTLRPHHSPPPSPSVAKLIAKRRAQRRVRQQLIWLTVVLVFLAIAVTVGLIMALTNDPVPEDDFFQPETTTTTRTVPDNAPPPPRPISILDPRLPQVTARRLPEVAWFYTDSSDPMDFETHESEESNTDSPRGPVVLTEGQFIRAGTSDHVYVTSIQPKGDQVVERATANLLLLDGSDRVFAQASVPLMLVGGTNTPPALHTLRIPVGADLRSRVIRVRSRVHDVQLLRDPARLTEIVAEPVEVDGRFALRVAAMNPTGGALVRAVFFIQAMDEFDRPTTRWSVDWPQTVMAGGRVEFLVRLGAEPGLSSARWKVVGAGQRMPTFATPAEPEIRMPDLPPDNIPAAVGGDDRDQGSAPGAEDDRNTNRREPFPGPRRSLRSESDPNRGAPTPSDMNDRN